ncbi:hypothetical protein MINS_40640 [Mycolicibacterium insubricum]|nr:hypothetical protein MINS_40640 [Mycolicibacterium insubricum]
MIVVDSANNRVVKLAEQSPTQTLLSFTGLNAPQSVSNDNGNLFVSDGGGTRVLWSSDRSSAPTPPWTASGSSREWSGPFTGLQNPHGVYAGGGAYYVVDTGNNRVLRWSSGRNTPEAVPFTGLNNPDGISALPDGPVVVDSGNNRVLLVSHTDANTEVQTVLGFTGLNNPHGVAVDWQGSVYVTDSGNNRVVKLTMNPTTHTGTQSILPFAGLNDPTGVAADDQGNLYVADTGNNRVLKLDKGFNH